MIIVPDQYQRAFVRKFAVVYVSSKIKLEIFRDLLIDVCTQIGNLIHNNLMEVWIKDTKTNLPLVKYLINNPEIRAKLLLEVLKSHYDDNEILNELIKLETSYQIHHIKPPCILEQKAVDYLLSPQPLIIQDIDMQINCESMSQPELVASFKKLQLTVLTYQVYREMDQVLSVNHIGAIKNTLQRLLQFIAQPLKSQLLTKQFQSAQLLIYAHAIPIFPVKIQPESPFSFLQKKQTDIFSQIFRPDTTSSAFEPGQKVVIDQLEFNSHAAQHFNQYLETLKNLTVKMQNLYQFIKLIGPNFYAIAQQLLNNKQVVLMSTKIAEKQMQTYGDALGLFRIQFSTSRSALNINCVSKLFQRVVQVKQLIGSPQLSVLLYSPDVICTKELVDLGALVVNFDQYQIAFQKQQSFYQKEFDLLWCTEQDFVQKFIQHIQKFIQRAQTVNFGINVPVQEVEKAKTLNAFLKVPIALNGQMTIVDIIK